MTPVVAALCNSHKSHKMGSRTDMAPMSQRVSFINVNKLLSFLARYSLLVDALVETSDL